MKKLKLNKQTIANLDNPKQIFGGVDQICTLSLNSHVPTVPVATCDNNCGRVVKEETKQCNDF